MASSTRSALLLLGTSLLLSTTAQAEKIAFLIPDPQVNASEHGNQRRAVSGALLNGMNFADPSIIQVNGESWAFATNGNGKHVQLADNPDFSKPSEWKYVQSDAFPSLPPWVTNEVWAPDVARLTDYDDSFAMYYAGRATINSKDVHCLGLARSRDNVAGPYTDGSSAPWFIVEGMPGGCREDAGGQIDPTIFRDSDGSWYVAYKLDGPRTCGDKQNSANCHKTPLYLAKLGKNSQGKVDGYTLDKGSEWPLFLFDNAGADDGYNIEAPALVMSNDGKTHFMFYSRGSTFDSTYKVSYTYSTNGIKGPWNNPRADLLATGAVAADGTKLYAPGGADITLLGANMVFHADADTSASTRVLHTGHLNWLPNYKVGIA
ncbi:hypothetical protein AMS68_007952 [Peltaster fructicola]|uniref:Endo-1,5-alpha-L-arabinanase A n=1 Tax=Peltaster fructicola TaxID=286661 RepID=A0A6H0Y6A8_9PEZI|nr:hypothetical protein AMS68_007952 [Peltaster fructicola]